MSVVDLSSPANAFVTEPLTPSATAPAASLPRNFLRSGSNASVICDSPVGGYYVVISIGWFTAMRPVVDLLREIGTRPGVDVSRNVKSLLRGQLLCAIERHEGVDERCRRIDARHTRPHVVAARPP